MSAADTQIPQSTINMILKNRKELQHLPEDGTFRFKDVRGDISKSTFWKANDHGIIKEVDRERPTPNSAGIIIWETADWLHAKYARFL